MRRDGVRSAHHLLITTFLNLLVSNLKMRGEAVIGQGARSTYFNAMLHQDQNWWSKKKGRDAYAALDDCFKIGESAKMFLQVPQQVFTSLTHVLTHATLVQLTKSVNLLWKQKKPIIPATAAKEAYYRGKRDLVLSSDSTCVRSAVTPVPTVPTVPTASLLPVRRTACRRK